MAATPQHIVKAVRATLAEDIGAGDLTATLVPDATAAVARVISRESTVVCGRPWFDETFRQLSDEIRIDWWTEEGAQTAPEQIVCELHGPARPILSGERTALNFLQILSGTANQAKRFAERIVGTKARVLDTRKTIPGLRLAQKYAVRVGGGTNHRIGLYDGILIKENHLRSTMTIAAAIRTTYAHAPASAFVEVEVESVAELEEALDAGAQRVLLDNFNLQQLNEAVAVNAGRALLEASGNVTLDNIAEIANTGVDYISVGAMTKHVHAADFSLLFDII